MAGFEIVGGGEEDELEGWHDEEILSRIIEYIVSQIWVALGVVPGAKLG